MVYRAVPVRRRNLHRSIVRKVIGRDDGDSGCAGRRMGRARATNRGKGGGHEDKVAVIALVVDGGRCPCRKRDGA